MVSRCSFSGEAARDGTVRMMTARAASRSLFFCMSSANTCRLAIIRKIRILGKDETMPVNTQGGSLSFQGMEMAVPRNPAQ